jgi:putative alpha-1,2-mannosidase
MFSGMGFYPVNPVSGKYVFGAPQLNKITLKLPNGKTFEIKANNLSKDNKYVKSIQLNGANIDMSTIDYKDIMKGGTLEYDMTNLH